MCMHVQILHALCDYLRIQKAHHSVCLCTCGSVVWAREEGRGADGEIRQSSHCTASAEKISLPLTVYPSFFFSERNLPPPHAPTLASSFSVRNDPDLQRRRICIWLIASTRENVWSLIALIEALSLMCANPAFFFCCIYNSWWWYHQRQTSLTKWEQQIDCSIRSEGPLSGNLIGSH